MILHRSVMLGAAAALGMLSLAACKKEAVTARDESVEAVANKVAAARMTPRPGRWEATVRLEGIEAAGLPPQAREAMGRQMSGQTFATCLTPEQAEKPDASFFQKSAAGCKYDKFVMADGRIDATMTCKQGASETRMTMAGTYGPDAYDLKTSVQADVQPGQPMTMTLGVAARHAGECNGTEDGGPAKSKG